MPANKASRLSPMTSGKIKPKIVKGAFLSSVDGFLVFYSPNSDGGVSVLNKEASFVLSLVDGKRTVDKIVELSKEEDPEIESQDIVKILQKFNDAGIITLGPPKPENCLSNEKLTHLGVWLHLTDSCNLRCKYCYVKKSSSRMSIQVARKAVEKIFEDAKKHNFKKITFKFSGGEPLLEFPKIVELVKLGKDLSSKFGIVSNFIILTNGTLLNKEISLQIKKENIRVMVSLDGSKEYNDLQRVFPDGSGTFDHIIKGIYCLQEAKVDFSVSVTITSKNIENIPDLTRYLLKREIPFSFNFYRENALAKEELQSEETNLVKYLMQSYQIIYDNPPPFSLISGLLDRVNLARPHEHTCGVGYNYLVVRYDGKICSCQMTLEDPIGSIDDEDLIKVMNSPSFASIEDLKVKNKFPCCTCIWKNVCCGGCPLLSIRQNGTCLVNSPFCSVYKKLIPEVLKIEARRIIKYDLDKN